MPFKAEGDVNTFDGRLGDWKVLFRWDRGGRLVEHRIEAVPKPVKVTWADAAKRISTGTMGAAKVLLGIDRTEEQVIAYRQAKCEACQSNVPCIFGTKRCCGRLITGDANSANPGCGCIIDLKVRVASAICPEGKW